MMNSAILFLGFICFETTAGQELGSEMSSEDGSFMRSGFSSEMSSEDGSFMRSGFGSEMSSEYEDYDFGSEMSSDYGDYDFGSEMPSGYDYDYEELPSKFGPQMRSKSVEDRAGKYNNCIEKANGDACKKRCKAPTCKEAKCWEKKCWTGEKYKTLSKAGKKQRKAADPTYNNCAGKKNGEGCTKKCQSAGCKTAKCCETVCLTERKFSEFKGKC